MRYLFLLLQLFFIFSVTELFANAPTFTSSMINNFLNNRTLTNENSSRSGNQFGNYNQNRIYDTSPVSSDFGRIYNNGNVVAPVQPRNADYDKIFQSAENYIKNGGELDPKLFLDDNLASEAMSASDAENSLTLKKLLQQYRNLINNPELQRNTQKNSPEARLLELKKIREDLQITIYNLYRILVNDPSIFNNKLSGNSSIPLRNTEKMEIDKRVENLNSLFDVLNLIIRHQKYPNLYFKSKESMPLGDIWGTTISGNGPTITTVAAMQNNNSTSGNNDAQNTGNTSNQNPDGNAQNGGSVANSDSNNDEQNAEAEDNEENNESEQNSDSDANDNDAGNQPPAANDAVQNDDDGEDGAVEAVRPSNDRIENDDDDWIGTGGIIGGVIGAGGLGALILNSDPIEPQYDNDFFGQPPQKQAVNRVTQDSVISNDDALINSDDLNEYERQDSPIVDNQTDSQEAKEQAVQEENNQEDEEENDSVDNSSDAKAEASKKDTTVADSDNESIADNGYDSDSEDTEADEDEEISEQPKTSARTDQTSRSDRTDQQPRRDQLQGEQSVQRNSASASRQDFEQDNYEKNTGIPDRNSGKVSTPNNSIEDYIRGSDVEDYIHGSDNSIEDYIYGSDNSVEDYISGEIDPYWNENDQYSTSSGSFYDRYQLVPAKNDRLRRYQSLDDEMLHADEF